MRFRTLLALCSSMSLALGGCSNVSQFDLPRDDKNVPSVSTIIQRIKCELAVVAGPHYEYKPKIDDGDYVVAIEIDVEVNDDGSLAPSLTYMDGMPFSFNAGLKFDVSRDQTFTEQLFFAISDIRDAMDADRQKSEQTGQEVNTFKCPDPDTFLAGDLGIVDSVRMALLSEGLDQNTKLAGAKGAFGGNVNFVMTKNLNAVGPTYSLKHFKGPGSLAGVSEMNTDKLTFAFAQRSATGDIPAAAATKANAKVVADTDVKSRAASLLAAIQTSQIGSQLVGIRANTK